MIHAALPVFTIGHSSRPLEVFLGLLAESRIACVVDVRRLPGSRSFPQYNADALAASLSASGIDYWHVPALCGRRTVGELDGVPPENFWSNASFARYAAHARSATFANGLDELVQRSARQRCALMCSEAVWWRCHRRIIADHLIARGEQVVHIMGPGGRGGQPDARRNDRQARRGLSTGRRRVKRTSSGDTHA
jgi:uncharacterized protein (DUF488 family)